MARADASKDPQHHGVNRHDEHGDAEDEIDDQELGVAAGLVLTLKEVHVRETVTWLQALQRYRLHEALPKWPCNNVTDVTYVRAQVNETFGASFSSGFSMTKSSAGPKLNGPAIMLVGNVSRCVL